MQTLDYFIGPYPQIADNDNPEFNRKIWKRKEFHDDSNILPANLKGHQRRLQRYASPVTPYDEVLLFHEMGTGKTRTSLAIAEEALASNSGINKVFVLGSKASSVKRIFTEELRKMKNVKTESEQREFAEHMKKYNFYSYETFARKEIIGKSAKALKKKFNKSVFILDEVHNMTQNAWKKKSPASLTWKRFKFLFQHTVTPQRKIVLLTGTPMVDSANDILPVIDLLVPGNLEEVSEKDLRGRVSYLKSDIRGDVPTAVYEGVVLEPFTDFKLTYLKMSDFQSKAYNEVADSDGDVSDQSFLRVQRDVALFAFPPPPGSDKIQGTVDDWCRNGNLTPAFWKEIMTSGKIDIKKICNLSCKFANVIDHIEKGPWPIYVYSTPTRETEGCPGPGLKLLSLILEKMGYSRFNGSPGKKYMYFTSKERPSQELYELFNKPGLNTNGRICKVVLGSKASSEGFTFRNIKREIILTPHWNYAVISQALARGVRSGAHDEPEIGSDNRGLGQVDISRLVAVPNSKVSGPCGKDISTNIDGVDEKIIDVYLYSTSEKKDKKIKEVEHMIKINSFDCAYNFGQNERMDDGSRDCEYRNCDYTCVGFGGSGPYQEPQDMVTYTWQRYYAPRQRIKRIIKGLFRNKNSLSFDEIMNNVDGIDRTVLISVLEEMMENRNKIKSTNANRPCFLSNDGNMINLTLDVIEPVGGAVRIAPYYISNPALVPAISNEQVVEKNEKNIVSSKLVEYLSKPKNLFDKPSVRCENCPNISTLPIAIQERILEQAVIYAATHDSGRKLRLSNKIKKYFMAALFGNETISALAYTFGIPGSSLRIFDNERKAWRNANQNELDSYTEKYEGTNVDLKNNKTWKPGTSACNLGKISLAAIFMVLDIKCYVEDESEYFPWLCPLSQPKPPLQNEYVFKQQADFQKTSALLAKNNIDFDQEKLKECLARTTPQLVGLLFLALKKKDVLFLDTNCGSTEKVRRNAKRRADMEKSGKLYGLFNFNTCTFCVKGPEWIISKKNR